MSTALDDFIRIHAPQLAVGITDDTELLDEGLLDSLGVMKLVAFLEHRYSCMIPEENIRSENFHNLAAIRKFMGCLTAVEPNGESALGRR
jgi:acyl carrier protein